MAPARTRLARKQNAGLLVGSPSFADTASRSRSQPKMEDNLFTSPNTNKKHLAERQMPINSGTDKTGSIPFCALTFLSDIRQKSLLELADRREEDTGSIVLLMENG